MILKTRTQECKSELWETSDERDICICHTTLIRNALYVNISFLSHLYIALRTWCHNIFLIEFFNKHFLTSLWLIHCRVLRVLVTSSTFSYFISHISSCALLFALFGSYYWSPREPSSATANSHMQDCDEKNVDPSPTHLCVYDNWFVLTTIPRNHVSNFINSIKIDGFTSHVPAWNGSFTATDAPDREDTILHVTASLETMNVTQRVSIGDIDGIDVTFSDSRSQLRAVQRDQIDWTYAHTSEETCTV